MRHILFSMLLLLGFLSAEALSGQNRGDRSGRRPSRSTGSVDLGRQQQPQHTQTIIREKVIVREPSRRRVRQSHFGTYSSYGYGGGSFYNSNAAYYQWRNGGCPILTGIKFDLGKLRELLERRIKITKKTKKISAAEKEEINQKLELVRFGQLFLLGEKIQLNAGFVEDFDGFEDGPLVIPPGTYTLSIRLVLAEEERRYDTDVNLSCGEKRDLTPLFFLERDQPEQEIQDDTK